MRESVLDLEAAKCLPEHLHLPGKRKRCNVLINLPLMRDVGSKSPHGGSKIKAVFVNRIGGLDGDSVD